MKYLFTAAIAFGIVPLALSAADGLGENPLKKAEVGDWAEYKLTITGAMNVTLNGKLKVTLVSKMGDVATLRTSLNINDLETNSQEAKVDLTKPFDPSSLSGLPISAQTKVEKVETGKGTEELNEGGKKFECKLTTLKLNAQILNQDTSADIKIWMCKDAPLTNLVRMELKSKLTDFTLDYARSGNKSDAAAEKK